MMEKVFLMIMFLAAGDVTTETVELETVQQCEALKQRVVEAFNTTTSANGRNWEILVLKAECLPLSQGTKDPIKELFN